MPNCLLICKIRVIEPNIDLNVKILNNFRVWWRTAL